MRAVLINKARDNFYAMFILNNVQVLCDSIFTICLMRISIIKEFMHTMQNDTIAVGNCSQNNKVRDDFISKSGRAKSSLCSLLNAFMLSA